ncbi:MAG: hypothetical protein NZM42_13730, partial [Gemmatales bacterium]|nr:hypothetical protein [Gemmatales bacterium]
MPTPPMISPSGSPIPNLGPALPPSSAPTSPKSVPDVPLGPMAPNVGISPPYTSPAPVSPPPSASPGPAVSPSVGVWPATTRPEITAPPPEPPAGPLPPPAPTPGYLKSRQLLVLHPIYVQTAQLILLLGLAVLLFCPWLAMPPKSGLLLTQNGFQVAFGRAQGLLVSDHTTSTAIRAS